MPATRRRGLTARIAATLALAVFGQLTMVAPASASAGRANWRAAVAAVPGQRYTAEARGYAQAAEDAVEPYASKLTSRRLADVHADSAARYLDGVRYRTEDDGRLSYQNRLHLLASLELPVRLGARTSDAAYTGHVNAMTATLTAGRLTADAAIQDATAALGTTRPSSSTPPPAPEIPLTAYQLDEGTDPLAKAPAIGKPLGRDCAAMELAKARAAFGHADQAMSKALPVTAAVLDGLAWRHAFHALAHLGITYTGDRDVDGLTDLIELRLGASPVRADTDGDGLTDQFEVAKLLTWTDPAKADADADGTSDAAEDTDGDGLTNLREQQRGTSPTEPDADRDDSTDGAEVAAGTDPGKSDTDGDTLLDGAEPRLGFSPTKADTDGDGTPDSAEAVAVPVVGPDGVRATLHGSGDLAAGLQINKVGGRLADERTPGLIGAAYDFDLGDQATGRLAQADLTLPYDPDKLGSADPDDLRVFYHDPEFNLWYPAAEEGQSVDRATHTVRATVGHFSTYAIFDIANWQQTWTASTNPCRSRSDGPNADVVFLDLSLVLDSSGSMNWNDPEGLRRSSAKNFVDALLPEDRAAVVDFDSYAQVLQPLTTDKAAIKAAIDQVDDSGGTDIAAGVRAGTDLLLNNGDPKRARIAILLTDGEGYYDPALTERARVNAISIYTIGLGSSVDTALLQSIADGTGGKYYNVATAADLPQVFRRISEETGGGDPDTTTDTDGDGLPNCTEMKGIRSDGGFTYVTDPTKADTDGDGLSDGEEAGDPIDFDELQRRYPGSSWSNLLAKEAAPTYPVLTDPTREDTDNDWLTDPEELDLGTSAWARDSDYDSLSDGDEVHNLNTLPDERNTDGDHWDDPYEVDHAEDEDLNPLFYNERVSKWTYAADFAKGFIAGDLWREDSLAWLLGSVCSGGLSFVPAIGWILGGIADLRDAIGSAIHTDFVGAGLSIVGIVPYAGDAVAIPGKIVKFIERNADKADEALALIARTDDIPRPAVIEAASKVLKGNWDELRDFGFSEDALLRLMRKDNDLAKLAEAVRGAQKFTGPVAGIMASGRAGERFLESFFQATTRGIDCQVWRSTARFVGNGRYFDVLKDGIAHESKVGLVKYSSKIEAQIKKDVWLRDNQNSIDGAHWHFFVSGRSGTVGPDARVLQLLRDNNIPYTIHLA